MKKPTTTNNMEELEYVIEEVNTLAAQVIGYLSFNRMWFEDDEEYQQSIDVVNKRRDCIINYIYQLVQENKELNLELETLNNYDDVTTN